MHIQVLGGFTVRLGDQTEAEWPTRRAAELVQLLVLSPGHRLPREQAIDALWPTLGPEAGGANLRKAVHHSRRALGATEAVLLQGGQVALIGATVDADAFEAAADAALSGRGDCGEAATLYAGDLLPESPYEDWAQSPRARLRDLQSELLRRTEQWERLLEHDATDELGYLALMRAELVAGRRPAAIRWYGRLRSALRRELGLRPSPAAVALYDECVAGLARPAPALVGRELELARIAAVLRSRPEGAFSVLALRGPGGIGKSALCKALVRAAPDEGWTPITATATESGDLYAPLIFGSALAQRLAEQATRHQVIGAFRTDLLTASGGEPVAFVFDDAHLADEATLDVLAHLGSPGGVPLLLVLAFRAESAPPALTRLMGRLERAGRLTTIDVAPLAAEDAAALAVAETTAARDPETVERIVALGEGNPFLTLELARSAIVGVPALVPDVRDAIASRFLDLDELALEPLRRMALAGDDLDSAAAVALAGSTEPEAFAALDEALRTGVLLVEDTHYRFRHELVRQALVDQLPPHQLAAAHREAAEQLAAAGAAPGSIARHWLAGERPSEAEPWLLAAARDAVRLGAYADAIGHLEPLLANHPAHGEGLTLRAEALDARGDARAPTAYLEASRAIGDPAGHDLRASGALATIKLGDPEGALRAIEGVEPPTLEGRIAKALTFAGAAALGYGDPAMGTAQAAEARRLALEAGDPAAVAVASWAQAAAAHARGELRDSVRADMRDTHALPQLAVSAFDGQLCITQRLLYGARPYADVIAFADSLEAEARRLGADRGRAFAVTIRGEAKLLAGRLEEADADLAEGVALHRALGGVTGEAFGLQRRSEVALLQGDRARADALLDEALAIARVSDVGFHLFDRIYGTKLQAAADPITALAVLDEAEDAVKGPIETCPGCRITFAVPAAIAAAQGGDLERARDWEQATAWLADVVMRLPAWHAAHHEVRAHIADAEGDRTVAEGAFRSAAEGFAAAEQPLDAARCAALAESPA